jgi:class 3 adenylate cyclase
MAAIVEGDLPASRAAIVEGDLPASHAAIAVGRFVVREGDVYGQTVDLAARIAAHAKPRGAADAGSRRRGDPRLS